MISHLCLFADQAAAEKALAAHMRRGALRPAYVNARACLEVLDRVDATPVDIFGDGSVIETSREVWAPALGGLVLQIVLPEVDPGLAGLMIAGEPAEARSGWTFAAGLDADLKTRITAKDATVRLAGAFAGEEWSR